MSTREITQEEGKELERVLEDYRYVEKRFRDLELLDQNVKFETAVHIICKAQRYDLGWVKASILCADLMRNVYKSDEEIRHKGIVGLLEAANDMSKRYNSLVKGD